MVLPCSDECPKQADSGPPDLPSWAKGVPLHWLPMARGKNDPEQKRTPAGLKRRAELMEAAVLLSAENGFGRTRVSDIVGKVGVGQGVFYWYFDSKDALFRELF